MNPPDDRELRGALVGCGFFARNHLHAWREIPDVRIEAVCDVDLERARQFARDFGIERAYNSIEPLLEDGEFDFVDLVTPPHTHRELVERVASAGRPVICQKPLAPTLEDGRAMVAACRKAGVPLFVHENFRWQVPLRETKHASEEIGPLHFARLCFRSGHDVYAGQPYLATDPRFIIQDLGVHVLDLARFFVGEFERLTCETSRVNESIRGEDLATVLLRGREGAHVVVELSYGSRPIRELFPQTLVLLEGREGTVELGADYVLSGHTPSGSFEKRVPPVARTWAHSPSEAIQDSVFHLQRDIVDCLRSSRPAETSGEDNLKTLELVTGSYESAGTRSPYLIRESESS